MCITSPIGRHYRSHPEGTNRVWPHPEGDNFALKQRANTSESLHEHGRVALINADAYDASNRSTSHKSVCFKLTA